ncbi:EMILIN-1-like [Micropterus dolomieu]|uniref:EMILIN-1-like n=1 Tax=Micropterus dolomieu TaxID=147949 RepID=UPI001E8ED563|nr:EMILIN-1-like [Micropterus dolomieu]
MAARLLLLLALWTCAYAKSAFPLRPAYSLYAGAHAHGARAASRHRNWCAFVVTKTVSCVVEDGVETYVKPDYHPCSWGSGQCSRVVVYRTYMRPRYKVAYKMVTEMEWKCCDGYSGEDCNDGPAGGAGTQISTTRPQPRPGQGGGGSSGSGQSGRVENEKMKQLEEKIQSLTRNLQDLQSTLNKHLQQEANKPGFTGGGGGGSSSGGRNPADAAQPEIKETIHNIQTKLDQLDNRTQAHDKTLVNISNHLVNGKGNELDGGGLSGERLSSLREEILRELERRVSLSCSSCQAGVEDLRRQQQADRESIRALEKQLNAMDARYRQGLDGLRREVERSQGCCDAVGDLQDRITDAERKISSASEDFDVLQNRLDKELSGGGGGFDGGVGGGRRDVVVTEDRLDGRLKDLERRINSTVQRTEQSCSYLENDLKDYFHRELGDLRAVFLDRFDDQAFRIADVELEVGLVKDRVSEHHKRLSKLENNTSLLSRRLEECGCGGSEGGGRGGGGGGRGDGGGTTGGDGGGRGDGGGTTGGDGGGRGDGGGTTGGDGGGRGDGGGTTGGGGGELFGMGGERKNTTEKSLEWRVVANEDQIRHFNTRLKDLSVSGDSLYDKVVDLSHDVRKIKALTGDHGEHFSRIVTEVELLGQDCELCGKVEDELQRLKNHSQDALGLMQSHINSLQVRLDSGGEGCSQICSHLEDEVRLLRDDVSRCTGQCKTGPDTPSGGGSGSTGGTSGRGPGLDAEKPLDGHSVIGGSINNNQLKTLQGELSEVILTFSSINDTLKGLEHTVQKHGSVITDLGNTKDKIISELDKIQQEVTEHIEESGERLDGMGRDVQRFESTLLVEIGDFECVFSGLPGVDAHVPRLSFSAALTFPMERAGTIVFDKIFVNEGDFYDPKTGIFTAPIDGRYFFSAILTGHKKEKIEAVLSKSNYGMARVDSGGYQPEGLENNPVAEAKTTPGSLAVFNIILPLQTRDTVCIDLVMGKLAHSVEPLTIFSGMLLYEDM